MHVMTLMFTGFTHTKKLSWGPETAKATKCNMGLAVHQHSRSLQKEATVFSPSGSCSLTSLSSLSMVMGAPDQKWFLFKYVLPQDQETDSTAFPVGSYGERKATQSPMGLNLPMFPAYQCNVSTFLVTFPSFPNYIF